MGGAHTFWVACAMPPGGQKCFFVMSLEVLPCSLFISVMHANGGRAVCCYRGIFFLFFSLFPSKLHLLLHVVGLLMLSFIR